MARTFNGTTQYLEGVAPTSLVSGAFTMAAWARTSKSTLTNQAVMGLANAVSDHQSVLLIGNNGGGAIHLLFQEKGATTISAALSATPVAINTWYHMGGVHLTNASRRAYLNGVVGTGDSTDDGAIDTPTRFDTGVLNPTAGLTGFLEGTVAEVAIWNIALTAAEMAALASGISPLLMRPANLVRYNHLFGYSPEPDVMSSGSLALTAAPTVGTHPTAIILPGGTRLPKSTFTATPVVPLAPVVLTPSTQWALHRIDFNGELGG